MIDLKDTTFIIPVKIESDDRLRNVITVCCFLLENFDTKVILKEVDTQNLTYCMTEEQNLDYKQEETLRVY